MINWNSIKWSFPNKIYVICSVSYDRWWYDNFFFVLADFNQFYLFIHNSFFLPVQKVFITDEHLISSCLRTFSKVVQLTNIVLTWLIAKSQQILASLSSEYLIILSNYKYPVNMKLVKNIWKQKSDFSKYIIIIIIIIYISNP